MRPDGICTPVTASSLGFTAQMPGLEKNVDDVVVRHNSKEPEGSQAAVQVLKKYLLDPDIMADGRKDGWIGSEA